MTEYLTAEELRQRQGMDFFVGDRLDEVLRLRDKAPATSLDEVWVSAHDAGAQHVEGGRVMGIRVVVTSALPAGRVQLWSDARKDFVS